MRRLLVCFTVAALTFGVAHAETQTQSCTKDLASGELSYATPSGYSVTMVSFSESHRDGRTAYGTCTITLRKN